MWGLPMEIDESLPRPESALIIDDDPRIAQLYNFASKRYDDDLSTCRKIASENINQAWEGYKIVHNWYIRPGMLWLPDKMEMRYKKLVKTCLVNRGHNVLD